MKILFAALRWDYKDPARGDSFEYTNFWDTLRRMDGVDPELFPFDELEAKHGRERMNRMLLDAVNEKRPDLVFFFFFTDEFDPKIVAQITSITPTVNWFADDQWRFGIYSRHWAPHLTWVATTDQAAADGYRALGFDNVIKTQWGCNHYTYRPVEVERDVDISFVGQPHGSRPGTISSLRAKGYHVETYGYGWEAGRLSQEEMIRMFSRSKINLNLSNASSPRSIRALSSVLLRRKGRLVVPRVRTLPAKLAEVRAKRKDQIKGRNFEIPGCRTFLLTTAVTGLEQYFRFGEEIAVFRDEADLAEKVGYFLTHEDERERIAEAGYKRTLAEHTYELRFREIFERIGGRPGG